MHACMDVCIYVCMHAFADVHRVIGSQTDTDMHRQ